MTGEGECGGDMIGEGECGEGVVDHVSVVTASCGLNSGIQHNIRF